MPPIRVKFVTSFSSQDVRHTVDNLVKGKGSWLCNASDRSGKLQADLQLEQATTISFLDLGNSGSVTTSIEVGRSSWPSSQPMVTLLPTVVLMTPGEWRSGKNSTAVRMFKQNDFNSEAIKEKWDKVRIVCTQPFRKDIQFGLSLFRLHTNSEVSNSTGDPLIELSQHSKTEFRKEELVSRMNLPTLKKKNMSESIGRLENKVLNNGEEAVSEYHSAPLTSPVSRAARLVVMAAKPISKSDAEVHKADIECEGLEYLISLNLTIEDICSMKVSGVRRKLEEKRGKELTQDEKMIFKNIALDFAKERLHRLETQQAKLSGKNRIINSSHENGSSPNNKSISVLGAKGPVKNSSVVQSKMKEREESIRKTPVSNQNVVKHGKFTFQRMNAAGMNQTPSSPRTVSAGRQRLREGDDLEFANSSRASRNDLALADSKVTTPKRSWNGRAKNTPSKIKENLQPDLDGWFTCSSKKRKGEISSFKPKVADMFSDDEIIEVRDDPVTTSKKKEGGGFLVDPIPFVVKNTKCEDIVTNESAQQESSGGYRLGSAPVNKFGVQLTSPSTKSHGDYTEALVECPLCSGFFESAEIESHAAACGCDALSGSSTDMSGDELPAPASSTDKNCMQECPICGDFFNISSLEAHAASCASSSFD